MNFDKISRYPFTRSLLKEYDWVSGKQLLLYVNGIESRKFDDYSLVGKHEFIDNLFKQIEECENTGVLLADLRETMGEGLNLYYTQEYSHIMQQYRNERKVLRKLLALIDAVFPRA